MRIITTDKTMPTTMKQLARLAGVSQPAVSAVVNNRFDHARVGAAKRKKILALVARHGFVPNHAARSLAAGRTSVVNVLVPSAAFFQNYLYSTILTGLQAAVEAAGLRLTVTSFSQGYRDQRALTGILADGLVFFYWGGPLQNTLLKILARKKMPLVAAYGRCPVPGIHNLYYDARTAMQALAARLIDAGHCRLAYAPTFAGDVTHQEGLEGVRQAVAARPECRLHELAYVPLEGMAVPRELFAGGRQKARALAADPFKPTAVIFNNDKTALGALAEFRALGVRVPDDLAVSGFEDVPYAVLSDPPLTSIDLRPREYGQRLGEVILSR